MRAHLHPEPAAAAHKRASVRAYEPSTCTRGSCSSRRCSTLAPSAAAVRAAGRAPPPLWCQCVLGPRAPRSHSVAQLAIYAFSTMAQTGVSGPVVVDGESFSDALFASAGQG